MNDKSTLFCLIVEKWLFMYVTEKWALRGSCQNWYKEINEAYKFNYTNGFNQIPRLFLEMHTVKHTGLVRFIQWSENWLGAVLFKIKISSPGDDYSLRQPLYLCNVIGMFMWYRSYWFTSSTLK